MACVIVVRGRELDAEMQSRGDKRGEHLLGLLRGLISGSPRLRRRKRRRRITWTSAAVCASPEAVREELAEIIGFETDDTRLLAVEVEEVHVSIDGRHATVRVGLHGTWKGATRVA